MPDLTKKLSIHPDGHVVYTCPHKGCGCNVRVQWADHFTEDEPDKGYIIDCPACGKKYGITATGESLWMPNTWWEKAFFRLIVPVLLVIYKVEKALADRVRAWSERTQEGWGINKYALALIFAVLGVTFLGLPDWQNAVLGRKVSPWTVIGTPMWVFVLHRQIAWCWHKMIHDSGDAGEVIRLEDQDALSGATAHRVAVALCIPLYGVLAALQGALGHPLHFLPGSPDIGIILTWVFVVIMTGPYVPPWKRKVTDALDQMAHAGQWGSTS